MGLIPDEELIAHIREIAAEVYAELGGGYSESVYEDAMAIVLRERGLEHNRQFAVDILFRGQKVGMHYLDFVIENRLVVELKVGAKPTTNHMAQTRAYMRTLGLKSGLVAAFPPDRSEPEFMELKTGQ